MFKFGKDARPQSVYAEYAAPGAISKTSVHNRNKAYANSIAQASTKVEADCGPGGGGVGGFGDPGAGGYGGIGGYDASAINNGLNGGMGGNGGGANGGYNVDRYNPVYDFLEEGTLLESWIPRDGAGMDLLFNRIYLRDPTIGPGIDLIKTLPWSEYTLDGIEDKTIKRIFEDTMEAINPALLMPDLTGDYLVKGKDILSLIFDEHRGIFSGVVAHDPSFVRISPLPIYNQDPLCDLRISPGFRNFLNSDDSRVLELRRSLPPRFLQAAQAQQGFLPLDPVSTVYMARKASAHDSVGTSLLTRCLYFWAIEKALLNAQMASTRRRSRPFIHLMAGLDNIWEPSSEEIDALAGMIQSVNEDPVGGVLATRTGVTISEPVGGGQDFYKWSDELELFAKYKMQAIGISDALLSGDATYANSEQARSVFVESLSSLRSRITQAFFYRKLFPTIARLHGFTKKPKAHIDHNIRVVETNYNEGLPAWARHTAVTSSRLTSRRALAIPHSELIMPTIGWTKQLRPNQDDAALDILERLKQNDYPVTLKQWANAAGLPSDKIEAEVSEDQELQRKIAQLQQEQELSEAAEGREPDIDSSDDVEVPDSDVDNDVNELLEEIEKDSTQSAYQKSKVIASGRVRRVSALPIWVHGKCGKLGRTEAIELTRQILMNKGLRTDAKATMSFLNQKLRGPEAQIMAYVLNRMGITRLPVSNQAAGVIMGCCAKNLLRSSNFSSEKTLQNVNRYHTEVKILTAFAGDKERVKDMLTMFKQDMGSKVLSGVG